MPEEKRTEMMEAIIQHDNLEMEAEGKYASARSRFASKPRSSKNAPQQDDAQGAGDPAEGRATNKGKGRGGNGSKPFQPNPVRHPVGAAARTA